jgi:hypothetical protein
LCAGLDPAGPYFFNTTADQRLDRKDAAKVDTIHTDIGYLGINKSLGQISFFPNWGHDQPLCKDIDWFGECLGRSTMFGWMYTVRLDVPSVQKKLSALKFRTFRFGGHVTYFCHHNLSF